MIADAWLSLAVALAVGLLVGSERERSGHGEVTGGVRTFTLAALAGCLAALTGPGPLAATVVGAAILAAANYLRRADADTGLTTEVALVLMVLLGAVAASSATLAAGAGVATAVVLVSKRRLHHFARQSITDTEVADALKFFVIAFIVLPLIPHASVGPYDAIDPRRVWTLVVAVTGLSWLGYLAVRVMGPGRGLPIAGLAGGFVSGAATTGAMARHARIPQLRRSALAAALMASVATLIQLILVTAIVDTGVAKILAPCAVAGSLVLVAEAVWLARKPPDSAAIQAEPAAEEQPPEVGIGRPFSFLPAVILAVVLSVLLVAARFAEERFGAAGTLAAISASGLADAHAGALTAATLASSHILSTSAAAIAALSAVAVNTLVKVVLAWTGGGRIVAARFAMLMVLPVVVVGTTALATLGLLSG